MRTIQAIVQQIFHNFKQGNGLIEIKGHGVEKIILIGLIKLRRNLNNKQHHENNVVSCVCNLNREYLSDNRKYFFQFITVDELDDDIFIDLM